MNNQFRSGGDNFPNGDFNGGMNGTQQNPMVNFPSGYGVFGQPPHMSVTPDVKRKTFRICLSGAAIIILAAALIFVCTGGTGNIDYHVPTGGKAEGKYIFSEDITDAPKLFFDENCPKISAVDNKDTANDSTLSTSEVYSKVSPSVVCIDTFEAGKDYILDSTGGGSGIILTKDGYIATNSHVVDDSSKTGVLVTLSDESKYFGTIVGYDKKTDLAVIKIDAEGLKAAEFENSDELSVGQSVFAIGTPLGIEFFNSLTEGTLSAVGRVIGNKYVKYIQTDAAVNPGNSGGALVDEYGRVIGMNTSKIMSAGYDNIAFAIPSNTIIEIVNQLIEHGKITDRCTLSVQVKDCTPYMSKENCVPQGAVITKILTDSPLENTEAEVNDIITAINDVTIKSTVELVDEMKKYKPGDLVKITLYRAGEKSYSFDVNTMFLPDR